jgi:hypothetical protein
MHLPKRPLGTTTLRLTQVAIIPPVVKAVTPVKTAILSNLLSAIPAVQSTNRTIPNRILAEED